LKRESENKEIIKLGDFGTSKNVENTVSPAYFKTELGRMTLLYSPPELIKESKFSYFTDIW
jgi:serine/threonine protein kinase